MTWSNALVKRVAPVVLGLGSLLRSSTGRANPRVRHVSSAGYALRAYHLLAPNIDRWQRHPDGDLFPALVQVQTVNRCNAACPMCPYPYTVGLEPYEEMSDELWSKIAVECAAEASMQVLVPMSKNEPLLDRRLVDRIAQFRKLARPHQQVELVTNGVLLDETRFKQLAAAGLDLITISVNAASAETYRAVMGGLNFKRIMRNLDALSQADTSQVNIFLRFIRQADNRVEEASFRRHWKRTKFNVLAYDVNDRAGTVRNYEHLQVTPSGLQQGFKEAAGRAIFPVCPHAFSIAHVLQNGDVPLCANDWESREVLGNVKSQSIRAIYNAPRARQIRTLMGENRYAEIAPCRDCSLWRKANWL